MKNHTFSYFFTVHSIHKILTNQLTEQACLCSALGSNTLKKPSGCIVSNRRLQKLEALLLKAAAIGKSLENIVSQRVLPGWQQLRDLSLVNYCRKLNFLLDWSMSFFSRFLPQGFEYRKGVVMWWELLWRRQLPHLPSLPHFVYSDSLENLEVTALPTLDLVCDHSSEEACPLRRDKLLLIDPDSDDTWWGTW